MRPDAPPILMAEDDAMDRTLIQEAFLQARVASALYFVEDGEQLLQYLRRQGVFHDEVLYPTPGLILLDLNMPRLDGWACLAQIRSDPALRHLPVVIMTTSNQEDEVLRSYALGANSFLCKPLDFDQLVEQVRGLGSYWCDVVELPSVE